MAIQVADSDATVPWNGLSTCPGCWLCYTGIRWVLMKMKLISANTPLVTKLEVWMVTYHSSSVTRYQPLSQLESELKHFTEEPSSPLQPPHTQTSCSHQTNHGATLQHHWCHQGPNSPQLCSAAWLLYKSARPPCHGYKHTKNPAHWGLINQGHKEQIFQEL